MYMLFTYKRCSYTCHNKKGYGIVGTTFWQLLNIMAMVQILNTNVRITYKLQFSAMINFYGKSADCKSFKFLRKNDVVYKN